jgi:hypothetical protein
MLIEQSHYAKVATAAHSAQALLRVPLLGLQRARKKAVWAGVAQLVEHLICNQRVGGSNPFVSSSSIQQVKDFGCTVRPSGQQASDHSFKVFTRMIPDFRNFNVRG